MKIKYLVILLFLLPVVIYSQINDELQFLSNQVKTERDSSESNYPLAHRSCNYDFKIHNDTLRIEFSEESRFKTDETDRTQNLIIIYEASLKDINDITVQTEDRGNEYFESKKSFFEINSLRSYSLFKKWYNNIVEMDTDLISLPIHRIKDTTTFRQLGALITNYGNIKDNYIDPNCELVEIKLSNLENNPFLAIYESGLEEPIKLNKNTLLNDELYKVLEPYLESENIEKFYGSIVLNANDGIEYISSYQNEMHNFYNSLESLSFGMQALRETAFLKISNEQLEDILNLLSKQNWETGKCNGIKANTYFDFHVKNERYKKSE